MRGQAEANTFIFDLRCINVLANLASTYTNQERWKKTEVLDVQVIETRKTVLAEKYLNTLNSIACLTFTLKSSRHNNEAISLMEKYFQLQKQILGPQHPRTEAFLETLNEWQMENIHHLVNSGC